jgi:heterodisulfide reductase subunit A
VNVLKGVLDKIGLDPGRVKIVWCAASEGEIFAKDLRDFIGELKAIGPIGTELKKVSLEPEARPAKDSSEKPGEMKTNGGREDDRRSQQP